MEKNELYGEEVILPLNTMLANGTALFVSNDRYLQHWIQVCAFYHDGFVNAVVKDFMGIFYKDLFPTDTRFGKCDVFRLYVESTIINVDGELIATCRNGMWTFASPGTRLRDEIARLFAEKACEVQ